MEAAWNLAFWASLIRTCDWLEKYHILAVSQFAVFLFSWVMLGPFAWLLSVVLVVHVSDAMPKRTRGAPPEAGQLRAWLALNHLMEDQMQWGVHGAERRELIRWLLDDDYEDRLQCLPRCDGELVGHLKRLPAVTASLLITLSASRSAALTTTTTLRGELGTTDIERRLSSSCSACSCA